MNPEHREIAIWAGGAVLLVIAGWIVLVMRGGTIDETADQARALHATYQQQYLAEDGRRLPADEAIALLSQRRDQQATELEAIEARLVWPGSGRGVPPEFAGFQFGPGAGELTNYATALDLVSRVSERLRRRGESLGIQLPQILPLKEEGALSNDDAAQRNLQLAQVAAYAAMVDLAMDAVVARVGPIELGTPWVDPTGTYAMVPATSVLEASYESADLLLRRLRDNDWGLGVERAALDFQEDGRFLLTLGVRLVVPYDPEWALDGASLGSQAAAGNQQRVGRGGARRGGR